MFFQHETIEVLFLSLLYILLLAVPTFSGVFKQLPRPVPFPTPVYSSGVQAWHGAAERETKRSPPSLDSSFVQWWRDSERRGSLFQMGDLQDPKMICQYVSIQPISYAN